jgi:hypothetical protein
MVLQIFKCMSLPNRSEFRASSGENGSGEKGRIASGEQSCRIREDKRRTKVKERVKKLNSQRRRPAFGGGQRVNGTAKMTTSE